MPLLEEQTRQLINTLSGCLATCTACARDCVSQGDKDLAGCIMLCSDCAELCGVCIPLIARDSEFTPEMCRLCADACERCARECDRTGMTECADACRAAAEACRQMVSA